MLLEDNKVYKRVTVRLYGKGVTVRDDVKGKDIKTKKQFLLKEGQFVFSRIDARNGAFGLATPEVNEAIVSNDFPVFDIDNTQTHPKFLAIITGTKQFFEYCQAFSSGTTGRQRISEDIFLQMKIPLPPLTIQEKLVSKYEQKITQAQEAETKANDLENGIEAYLLDTLGIEIEKPEEKQKDSLYKFLQFVELKDITEWGVDKILFLNSYHSSRYKLKTLPETFAIIDIFRGKSPKYEDNTKAIILNQKCNRWNEIQLEHAKTVNEEWFNSIDKKFKTLENDILINSTGEGTIGRSSMITEGFENMIYDSHILLLRLDTDKINPLFWVYQFNSSFGQEQLNQIKSGQSTKQTELGLENLSKIRFAIPPLSVQNEITLYIQSQKSEIKRLRVLADELRTSAQKEFEQEIFN